jgi:hypothetical protein
MVGIGASAAGSMRWRSSSVIMALLLLKGRVRRVCQSVVRRRRFIKAIVLR